VGADAIDAAASSAALAESRERPRVRARGAHGGSWERTPQHLCSTSMARTSAPSTCPARASQLLHSRPQHQHPRCVRMHGPGVLRLRFQRPALAFEAVRLIPRHFLGKEAFALAALKVPKSKGVAWVDQRTLQVGSEISVQWKKQGKNFASPLKWLLNGSSRAAPGPGVPGYRWTSWIETTMSERGALALAGYRSGDTGGRP
jgi:hypothetical protein